MTAATVSTVIDAPHLQRLKRVAKRLEESAAERDAAIIAAWTAGAVLSEIARPLGMSDPGVKKVLNRLGVDTTRRLKEQS